MTWNIVSCVCVCACELSLNFNPPTLPPSVALQTNQPTIHYIIIVCSIFVATSILTFPLPNNYYYYHHFPFEFVMNVKWCFIIVSFSNFESDLQMNSLTFFHLLLSLKLLLSVADGC